MKITVKQLAGPEGLIEVSPELKIADLKEILEKKWKINPNHQRLVMKGKPLEDMNSLHYYGISEGSKIFLTVKKNETPAEPTSPSSFMSQMLSSLRPLGSDRSSTPTTDFWEQLDSLLQKHFTREDAVRVKEHYRKYLKQCVGSLSLDDVERLATFGLEREKCSQGR